MSNDDDKKLPVPRSSGGTPSVFAPQPRHTGGLIETALTHFGAKLKTRAHDQLADLNRAKADELRAYGEMVEAYKDTAKVVASLDDLHDEITLESADRAAQRGAAYAKLEYDRDEREHGAERAKLRREREVQQDRRALEDASRDLFNAKQGLEKQQRLAQVNSEIWEKRKETERMDAEKVRLLLSREIQGLSNPEPRKAGDGTLEQLRELRDALVKRAVELSADGDASHAEKYERLVNEVDELLIEAVRGRRQE
jgi:hypothetical protein